MKRPCTFVSSINPGRSGITRIWVPSRRSCRTGQIDRVQEFLSYCRLVKCARESGGKRYPSKNNKIGNVHLKWAFSEAAVLFLKGNERAQMRHSRRVSKYGKSKALSILASDLGRAVYFMLKRKEPFDLNKFLGAGDVSQTPNRDEKGKTLNRAAKNKCIEECETAAVKQSP